MIEAIIRSQVELDFAFAVIRKRREGTYIVRIQSEQDKWLSVREQPVNCHVEACDSSHVEAYGSSHVKAYQYATVRKSSKYTKVESAGAAVVESDHVPEAKEAYTSPKRGRDPPLSHELPRLLAPFTLRTNHKLRKLMKGNCLQDEAPRRQRLAHGRPTSAPYFPLPVLQGVPLRHSRNHVASIVMQLKEGGNSSALPL